MTNVQFIEPGGGPTLPGQSLDDEVVASSPPRLLSDRSEGGPGQTSSGHVTFDDGRNNEDWAVSSVGRPEDDEEPPAMGKTSTIGYPTDKDKQQQKLNQMLKAQKRGSQEGAVAVASGYISTDHMLEEALQMDSKHRFRRAMLKSVGVLAIIDAARKERRRRAAENYVPQFPCLTRAVESALFELIMGFLMLLNGGLIGVEASFDKTPQGHEFESIFELLEHVFTAIFVLELGLRILVFGWVWVLDFVNFLDTVLIIFTGVLPMWILSPMNLKSDFVRVLQVLRILRLVRLIRMFRTVRFLRTGYKLTQGLVNGGTIILHTYVMIIATLYVFAVFSVYLVGRSRNLDDSVPEQAQVKDLFKTVPAAMFTLFDFITLNDWTETVRPTQEYTSVLLILVILVIMVMTLVLNNLITAVIVTHALGGLKEDTELMAAEKRQEEETNIRDLRRVFEETVQEDSDFLMKEDFLAAMNDRNSDMRTKLGGMQIALCEAEEVWELLDASDEGIDIDKFSHGLRALRGEALAKDSFAVAQHIKRINTRISRLSARLAGCKGEVDRLRSETAVARRDLGNALMEIHKFIQSAGKCVPMDGITKTPKHMTAFQQKRIAWRCQ